MLLLMFLRRWAEGLLLPGTSTVMHTAILNAKEAKSAEARGSKPARPMLVSCFGLRNIRHSTRRMVGSCRTTHLAFLSSPSVPQVLRLFHQRQIWPVTHKVQETRELKIYNVQPPKCFICLALDIQIAHCSLFFISIFFLLS